MTLLDRLRAGPGSRELSDELLWEFEWDWRDEVDRPDPTRNVQDALDVIFDPDRYHWEISEFEDEARLIECDKDGYWTIVHTGEAYDEKGDFDAPRALCIAGILAKEKIE